MAISPARQLEIVERRHLIGAFFENAVAMADALEDLSTVNEGAPSKDVLDLSLVYRRVARHWAAGDLPKTHIDGEFRVAKRRRQKKVEAPEVSGVAAEDVTFEEAEGITEGIAEGRGESTPSSHRGIPETRVFDPGVGSRQR